MIDRHTCKTIAAVACLAACLGDVVVPLVLGARVPGYSHLRQVQSELGMAGSPVARWMNGWWVVFGVLLLVFAAGLECTWHGRGLWLQVLAAQVAVVGLVLGVGAGLFPMDPSGAAPTLAGRVHEVGGGVGFLALLMVPVTTVLAMSGPRFAALRIGAAVILALGVVSLVLLGRSHQAAGTGIWTWAGLWQRAFLGTYYVLLVWLAVEMFRAPFDKPSA